MIGTNQAAIIATRMISTFQATKVGLMVGIGGGIPPKVKLGDIVVSRPTDQYPGVVQWDLGKTESGKFRRTGALNKPPSAADSLIDAKSGVQSLLHSIFSWWGAEGTAGAVDLGAAERETKDVDIHYGLVASGNQVIKDAVLRDRLNESLGGNVLCIEMEVAGLMDDFPCLVIRGVCDYADSEKNDEWQQYAAAIAAAYAKVFLRCLQPAAIANEPLMRDVLNQVDDITKALQFATTKYSRVFIIIDALDECQTSDYCRGNFLSEVFRLYTHCGVNMFATSRHIQEIIAQFELEGDTTLEIRAHEEDIRSYLDDQIKQSRRPILLKNCEVIKSEIARIVDGMFLLATFHFQSIKNKTTVTQLNEALKYLATGPQGEMAYNLAYKGAMERIENQNPDFQCLADQLLSWVVCAERPLIKEELQFALAVKLEVDQPEIEKNNFTEVSDMISVCAGLVTIDEESNVVRLIHYTTQEYFNQAHKQWIYNAQGNTARVCPTYLSFETFDTGLIPASATLYRYAAQNWGHHTRKSLVKTTQSSIMLREGVDLEARDEWDRRPLSLAADEGHATVVELLLCAGADPEFESAMGLQTPLEYAVNRGQGQTPLSQAAKIG
ncbi:hypothetical protein TWF103_004474 [Orbilia oligospora]|nr:hypothetical protein TWF103_004474 [Orbilia oligospora]